MSLITELKRRNVFRVGAAYMALAWVIVQITGAIVPALNLPDLLVPVVVWIGVIGFPCVLIFSWVYELTPEGLKRESEVERETSIAHQTGKRLDLITIVLVVVAIGFVVVDRLVPHASQPANETGAAPDATQNVPANAQASSGAEAVAPHPAATAAPAGDRSIAVLPFVNMSEDPNNEFFADGISEELLNLLAKIPELQVTSRSSAFAFKGEKIDIPVLAAKLKVAHVLEGSVRKSGKRVRITAQLLDARQDKHLWSETYDRDLDDIFAVQDEIAAAVVQQLKIKLLGAVPQSTKTDPRAYTLTLQSRQLYRQGTEKGFQESIELAKQALAIDPQYAPAWIRLAGSYSTQADYGLRSIDDGYGLAREAIDKALAADPQSAHAHTALAWMAKDHDNDLPAAIRHITRALELAPTDPLILGTAAGVAQVLGHLDEAIAVQEYLVAHDPVNSGLYTGMGVLHKLSGRLPEALAALHTAHSLAPEQMSGRYAIGEILLLQGDAAAALAEFEADPAELWRLIGRPMALHGLGRTDESDPALQELIAKYETVAAYNIAYVEAWCGQPDQAFEWLDKAVTYHDAGLQAVHLDPLLASLHKDPRWLPFLRKIGRAPEQLAAIKFDVKVPQQ